MTETLDKQTPYHLRAAQCRPYVQIHFPRKYLTPLQRFLQRHVEWQSRYKEKSATLARLSQHQVHIDLIWMADGREASQACECCLTHSAAQAGAPHASKTRGFVFNNDDDNDSTATRPPCQLCHVHTIYAVSFIYEGWAVAQIVPCIHRSNCPSSWAVAQGPFSAANIYTEPLFLGMYAVL